jgi:23S rRNA pseudouridine1911/1915/1917 synthase
MNQLNLEVAGKKERLDAWMGSQLPDLSRSRLQKLIEQGYIQLNGQICTNKNTKVAQGDRLKITIPDSQPLQLSAEAIELDILYEDEYLIIINKPANLVVHPTVVTNREPWSTLYCITARI